MKPCQTAPGGKILHACLGKQADVYKCECWKRVNILLAFSTT